MLIVQIIFLPHSRIILGADSGYCADWDADSDSDYPSDPDGPSVSGSPPDSEYTFPICSQIVVCTRIGIRMTTSRVWF